MQKKEIIQELKTFSEKEVKGSEKNVKIHVVIKLLEILGHSNDIELEHSYHADRPDIIIKGFEQPIIIEVKGANENLVSHIPQIQRYSYSMNACLSILTNGYLFYFFSPFYKRKSFAERLILSLSLRELGKEEIAEKIISVLDRGLGFEQISKNIAQMENEISTLEEEINEKQRNISDMKNKTKSSEEKYLKIEQLKEHMEFLDPKIKSEIDNHTRLKEQILNIEREVKVLQEQIPSVITPSGLVLSPQRGGGIRQPISPSRLTGNFSLGISDEVINIRALQQGKQIILCKTQEKSSNYIFILAKN